MVERRMGDNPQGAPLRQRTRGFALLPVSIRKYEVHADCSTGAFPRLYAAHS